MIFPEPAFNGETYRYQGNSQTQRLGVSRTLLRDGTRKFAIDIGLTRRRTETAWRVSAWRSVAQRSAYLAWAEITVQPREAAI